MNQLIRKSFWIKVADGVCLWDVPFDFFKREYLEDASVIHKYTWFSPGLRILSETVPHYIQCLIMLVMASERFVLVCFPTEVREILNSKRRRAFYLLLTALLCLTPVFTFFTYRGHFEVNMTPDEGDKEDPFGFSRFWGVGSRLSFHF